MSPNHAGPLLGRQHCDLVLVEVSGQGIQAGSVAREVGRKPTLWPQWPGIVGIASGWPGAGRCGSDPPVLLTLSDIETVAEFVLSMPLR